MDGGERPVGSLSNVFLTGVFCVARSWKRRMCVGGGGGVVNEVCISTQFVLSN